MKPSIKTVWLFLLGLLITPASAFAQIFECIDSAGNTEFAQKCSPGTVKQREVVNAATTNSKGDNAQPQKSYKDEEAGFRQRQLEREQAEANDVKARAAAEAAIKKCKDAQSRLVAVENARRLSGGIDPQTGERKFLNDDERAAATQKARDNVATACKQ